MKLTVLLCIAVNRLIYFVGCVFNLSLGRSSQIRQMST